jgi:hypothetical protein
VVLKQTADASRAAHLAAGGNEAEYSAQVSAIAKKVFELEIQFWDMAKGK